MSVYAIDPSLHKRWDVPPPEEFSWRVKRLTQAMADEQLDELLIYGWPWRPDNVRYLTGAPVVTASLVRLRSDGRVTAVVSSETDRAAILRVGWVADVRRTHSFTKQDIVGLLDGI